jgi:hypothetical protein
MIPPRKVYKMSILYRIDTAVGDTTTETDKALAAEIAKTGDRAAVAELITGLDGPDKNVQSSCIKVIYETGYVKPKLIADYWGTFLKLLDRKNNRLVWGGMVALSCVAEFRAAELFPHVERFGDGLRAKKVQTDNGSEFVGNHKAKKESGFTEAVKYRGGRHVRIPPRSATFNSDVEAFDGLIEREFYRVEDISSLGGFLGKAYAYVAYFNLKRHNRGKDDKTPYEIGVGLCPGPSERLFTPFPIVLDFVDPLTRAYHVPWADIQTPFSPCGNPRIGVKCG